MKNEDEKHVEFAHGEVCLWPEQGSSIMIKAITKSGDPVELEPDEAKELGELLIGWASQIE